MLVLLSRKEIKKNAIIDQLSGINRNSQGIQFLPKHTVFIYYNTDFGVDLLQDIKKINKVALIVIDSAGLTTNFVDIEALPWHVTFYKQSNFVINFI